MEQGRCEFTCGATASQADADFARRSVDHALPRTLGIAPMILPDHKTKIVATIGPASNSPEILESLIRAGMNIARLNFSHGSFAQHAKVIARIRTASKAQAGGLRSGPPTRTQNEAVLPVAGPSPRNPEANQRLELMVFEETASWPAEC
jgi:hypothetical protein